MSNNNTKQYFAIFILLLAILISFGLTAKLNINVAHSFESINAQQQVLGQNDIKYSTILDTLQYNRSIHVLLMLLAGFGFLMVVIRGHGFQAITATYLMVSLAIPLYILIKSFGGEHFAMDAINIKTLLFAEFAAASLLIAIGAPLGRLSMDQYLVLGLMFIPAYIFNEWLILESGLFIGLLDTGGSIAIHAFGAYFGLGVVTNKMHKYKTNIAWDSDDTSNVFSLLGSVLLWIFWPSFTSAIVEPQLVVLTAFNTIFALCGSTLATYVVSKILRGKVGIEDIANASLAGGVAIGSICSSTTIGFAMFVGILAGILSTVGYNIISPKLEKLIKGVDSCGINNLHGMPGILGGVVAAFITGNFAIQIGGIITTVVVAYIAGNIAGKVMSLCNNKKQIYCHEDEFVG